jgi:hypothetical protein
MTQEQLLSLRRILKQYIPLAEFSDDAYKAQDLLNWVEEELLKI